MKRMKLTSRWSPMALVNHGIHLRQDRRCALMRHCRGGYECFASFRVNGQKHSETKIPPPAHRLALTNRPMTTSPHILVVEDDREISSLITRYLRANDCRVSVAASGRDVGTILDTSRINLIVLDLM